MSCIKAEVHVSPTPWGQIRLPLCSHHLCGPVSATALTMKTHCVGSWPCLPGVCPTGGHSHPASWRHALVRLLDNVPRHTDRGSSDLGGQLTSLFKWNETVWERSDFLRTLDTTQGSGPSENNISLHATTTDWREKECGSRQNRGDIFYHFAIGLFM